MRRKRFLVVGALLAAGCVAVGIAYAAIPDGNTINGCYGKAGGVLRVTDTAKNQKCSSQFEVPISWNQQGPKGDTGAPGEKGAQGIPGQQGPPGVSGRVVVTADYQSGGGVVAQCPQGTVVLGGGYNGAEVVFSGPVEAFAAGLTPGSGWVVLGTAPHLETLTAYAICATVG